MNARVASVLIGPGAQRLAEIEERAKKRFYVEGRDHVLLDFLNVAEEGTVEALAPASPVAEGATASVKLVELALHDGGAAVGKLDGLDICVANAAGLVGKTVKVRVERVLPDLAYGTLVERSKAADEPLTAESLAEKPTRAPAKRKAADGEDAAEAEVEAEVESGVAVDDAAEIEFPEGLLEAEEAGGEDEIVSGEATGEDGTPATPKKRTRRGSRGGRRRRKPVADGAEPADGPSVEEVVAEEDVEGDAADVSANGAVTEPPKPRPARAPRSGAPRIHVPSDALGREGDDDEQADEPGPVLSSEDPAADGDTPTPKKRTRRGSRGGRRRRKPAGATATAEGGEDAVDESSENGAVETALAEVVAEPTTPDEA
jgi:predicted RNA-binding protein with TRAM domain